MKQEHPLEKYSRIASAICCLLMSGFLYVEAFTNDFNRQGLLLDAMVLTGAGIWGWIGGHGAVRFMGIVAFAERIIFFPIVVVIAVYYRREFELGGLKTTILNSLGAFSDYDLLFFGCIFVFLVSSIHGLLWVLRWVNGKLKTREQTT